MKKPLSSIGTPMLRAELAAYLSAALTNKNIVEQRPANAKEKGCFRYDGNGKCQADVLNMIGIGWCGDIKTWYDHSRKAGFHLPHVQRVVLIFQAGVHAELFSELMEMHAFTPARTIRDLLIMSAPNVVPTPRPVHSPFRLERDETQRHAHIF